MDHKIPYSRGGKTVNENLAISCEECNKDKSDMTEKEYTNYLEVKETTINENNTLHTIKKLIEYNNNITNIRIDTMKLLETTTLRKKEIEKCIEDENFNASQGYMLCKELKDIMITISRLKAEGNNLIALITTVQQDNIILNTTYKELTFNVMKELRSKMNIGNIAKLQLVS